MIDNYQTIANHKNIVGSEAKEQKQWLKIWFRLIKRQNAEGARQLMRASDYLSGMPDKPIKKLTQADSEAQSLCYILASAWHIEAKPVKVTRHDPNATYRISDVRISRGKLEGRSFTMGYWFSIQAWKVVK